MSPDLTVLIVDDDAGHRALIERNLRRGDFHGAVRAFADGAEVLDYLHGRGPEPMQPGRYLMLLDLRMPAVGGHEVLGRLKSDPRLRALPVVVLTTSEEPGEIRRAAELGCNLYLVKSVDYDRLTAALGHLARLLAYVQVPPVDGPPT